MFCRRHLGICNHANDKKVALPGNSDFLNPARQQHATIDLGITPVLPNYSRIPSLTSGRDKRGD
jgi:hypothetical protein